MAEVKLAPVIEIAEGPPKLEGALLTRLSERAGLRRRKSWPRK